MIDLGASTTQKAFGDLVGISQAAVSSLVDRKILRAGAPAGEWLNAYLEHIRAVAMERGASEALKLKRERCRVLNGLAEKIERKNARTRAELAPRILLEQILAKSGARASRIFATIPAELRRCCPFLTVDNIAAVEVIVGKVRDLATSMRLSDLDMDDDIDQVVDRGEPPADPQHDATE